MTDGDKHAHTLAGLDRLLPAKLCGRIIWGGPVCPLPYGVFGDMGYKIMSDRLCDYILMSTHKY